MPQPIPLARDASPLLSLIGWVAPLSLLAVAWLPMSDPMPLAVNILFTLLALALAALFVVMPRRLSYVLTDEGLQVTRMSGRTLWPYAELRAAPTSGGLGLKIFGSGVSGYYSGTYAWNGSETAQIQALASRREGGVIVQYRGQSYFLTPADPAAFLQALAARGVPVQ